MITRSLFGMVSLMTALGAGLIAPPGLQPAPPSVFTGENGDGRFVATIFVYHRFGPTVADGMTVRTSTFRHQLQYLREHDYPVVPLRVVIDYLHGRGPAPPARAVVITADDGHRSIWTDMRPVVAEYRTPVTLFIYPSALSNAAYALTWDELVALRAGWFDVQSHAYWHPNLAKEKRRLAPGDYHAFVVSQLMRSRTVLARRLGGTVDAIAWPFGVYDETLLRVAEDCGYVAGFTLERRPVRKGDPLMALPRYLVTDEAVGQALAAMLPV